MMSTDDILSSIISYFAAGLGFCATVDWMATGAAVLLIAIAALEAKITSRRLRD